jgi:hypothetical protein
MALRHHLHQIPESELEAEVPPHAQYDDLTIKVATLKQFIQTQEPSHGLHQSPDFPVEVT